MVATLFWCDFLLFSVYIHVNEECDKEFDTLYVPTLRRLEITLQISAALMNNENVSFVHYTHVHKLNERISAGFLIFMPTHETKWIKCKRNFTFHSIDIHLWMKLERKRLGQMKMKMQLLVCDIYSFINVQLHVGNCFSNIILTDDGVFVFFLSLFFVLSLYSLSLNETINSFWLLLVIPKK